MQPRIQTTDHLTTPAHDLQQQIEGRVLLPGDPDYDQVRGGWNRSIEQRPALILIAQSARDVVAVELGPAPTLVEEEDEDHRAEAQAGRGLDRAERWARPRGPREAGQR